MDAKEVIIIEKSTTGGQSLIEIWSPLGVKISSYLSAKILNLNKNLEWIFFGVFSFKIFLIF